MKKITLAFSRVSPSLLERYKNKYKIMASAKNLEIISSISVGFDNYDLTYFNGRGIMLTNTPDVLNETTADLAFA
jgi:gluconate 2-dehydrogenase